MNKDEKYNRSPKGLARYAAYRRRHWMRIESYELERNRRRRKQLELPTED